MLTLLMWREVQPMGFVTSYCLHPGLPITNYQMALSKQGAGGGSATHKEPT